MKITLLILLATLSVSTILNGQIISVLMRQQRISQVVEQLF